MGRKKKAAVAPAIEAPVDHQAVRLGAVRIARAYMGDGNTPPVEGGLFPALELERLVEAPNAGDPALWAFCGRHVGRQGQSFDELREEAKVLHGVSAPDREGWKPEEAKQAKEGR